MQTSHSWGSDSFFSHLRLRFVRVFVDIIHITAYMKALTFDNTNMTFVQGCLLSKISHSQQTTATDVVPQWPPGRRWRRANVKEWRAGTLAQNCIARTKYGFVCGIFALNHNVMNQRHIISLSPMDPRVSTHPIVYLQSLGFRNLKSI